MSAKISYGRGLLPEDMDMPNAAGTTLMSSEQAHGEYMKLSFLRLLFLFTLGSIVGLIIETIFHFVAFGDYESRAGLVWGPFSPLYGFAAVALTIMLNRIWQKNGFVIFVICMVVGTVVEFITSWGMEVLFGAVAWDYSGTFGNIQGRVDLFFSLIWGVLGLLWARVVMPVMKKGFEHIDWHSLLLKAFSAALVFFLLTDCIVTMQAFNRESEREQGVPAVTKADVFIDAEFPSAWMSMRFENLNFSDNSL